MSAASSAVTVAAAVGAGCVGGVFFAFSSFVIPALNRLPATAATAAMQVINTAAVRPPLMIALFGTAALAFAAPVLAWRTGHQSAGLLTAAGALYVIGTIGTTVAANVPLNDALAATTSSATDAEAWSSWSAAWTARNQVRTAAALVATALYATALLRTARA